MADLCLSSAAAGGDVSLAEPFAVNHQDRDNADAVAAHEAWRRKLSESARRAVQSIGQFRQKSNHSQRTTDQSAPADPPLTPLRRSSRVPAPKDITEQLTAGKVMPKGRPKKSTKAKKPKKESSDTYYSVRRIAAERIEKGQLFYLIDWANNPETGESYDPTWVCFGSLCCFYTLYTNRHCAYRNQLIT